jgi:hypothetical protein
MHAAAQRREHVGHGQTVFLARRNRRQLYIRMNGQQSQQFHAGITGAANNAHFDHVVCPLQRKMARHARMTRHFIR